MIPRRYPLAPLSRLREERAEARTRELGGALSTEEAARRRRGAAEAAREAERARADGVRRTERASLERGELSVLDLARAGAWDQRVRAEDAERARSVEAARASEREAVTASSRARSAVALARAEVEAMARHQGRWESARRREAEAREEEVLGDLRPASGGVAARGGR